MHLDLGDVPTWGLLFFALVGAVFAIMAFRKQSEEVRLLKDDAEVQVGERRREAEERRRAQAASIYVVREYLPSPGVTIGNPTLVRHDSPLTVAATVHNTGGRPIYDVRVHWVDAGAVAQAGCEELLGTIGPGEQQQSQRDAPGGFVIPDNFVPVAYFRDAADLGWTLTPGGQLGQADPLLPAGAPLIATGAIAHAKASGRLGSRGAGQLTDRVTQRGDAANTDGTPLSAAG